MYILQGYPDLYDKKEVSLDASEETANDSKEETQPTNESKEEKSQATNEKEATDTQSINEEEGAKTVDEYDEKSELNNDIKPTAEEESEAKPSNTESSSSAVS